MAEVARALIERADEVTEDVIEMLASLADFQGKMLCFFL